MTYNLTESGWWRSRPRTLQVQPTGWATGLDLFAAPVGTQMFDVVRGVRAQAVGAVGGRAGQNGWEATAGSADDIHWPFPGRRTTFPNGVTLVQVFRPRTGAPNNTVNLGTSYNTNAGMRLQQEFETTELTKGSVATVANPVGSLFELYTFSAYSWSASSGVWIGFQRRPTQGAVSGAVFSATGTHAASLADGDGIFFVGGLGAWATGTYGLDGDMVMAAIWSRALTERELFVLSMDPWLPVRPPPARARRTREPAAVVGGSIPKFMHHYTKNLVG